MKATLKTERLRNFEAVIDQTYTFGDITEVCGTNGTGKTTLFNAFTFCLFGKDSNGRTDFGFKRRDANGEVVHNAEYGVELVFDIDGKERVFERVVTEKWVKPRGGSEKVLSGHETAYYVDRVRCATMKEYVAAVNQISTEDVMRILTDTFYFMSLREDTQKAMLLKMAYGTSDIAEADKMASDAVVSKEPALAAFVNELNGTALRDFNAAIQGKINAIKGELNDIPIRIAAKQEAMPAEEDWDGLQAVIDENRAELENIERQMADENAREASSEQKKNALRTQQSNLELELVKAQNSIRTRVTEEESGKRKEMIDAETEYTTAVKQYNANRELSNKYKQEKEAMLKRYNDQIAEHDKRIVELTDKANALREQYRAIKNDAYTYADEELECPTCHRPYDFDKLKEQKLAENVSLGKSIMQVEIPQVKEAATVLAHKRDEEAAKYDEMIADMEMMLSDCRLKVDDAHRMRESIAFTPADVNALCLADPKCKELTKQIAEVKKQIAEWPVKQTNEQLATAKRDVEDKIASLQKQMASRDMIANVRGQIAELEDKQRALNAELAVLEKKHDTAKEYQKAKDRELLAKVNGLFGMVTWDFVTEQLNGNDRIACNCYVNGKPYSECNHALQVNAGLDIINAIGRSEDVHLPIFIDNAESVVEYIGTDAQMILLKVDEAAKELKFNIR